MKEDEMFSDVLFFQLEQWYSIFINVGICVQLCISKGSAAQFLW